MIAILWSDTSLDDLERLHRHLDEKNPRAADAAVAAIHQGLLRVTDFPHSGRPIPDNPPNIRDWIIPYGAGAYVIRYRFDGDSIFVLAARHSRENRF